MDHAVTGGDYASFAAGTVSVTVDDDETASDTVTLSVSAGLRVGRVRERDEHHRDGDA